MVGNGQYVTLSYLTGKGFSLFDLLSRAGGQGLYGGGIALVVFLLWPLFWGSGFLIRNQQFPSKKILKRFSNPQKMGALLTVSALIVLLVFSSDAHMLWTDWHLSWLSHAQRIQAHHLLETLGWGILGVFTGVSLLAWLLPTHHKAQQQRASAKKTADGTFSLWLGQSTGKLIQRGHGAAMAPQQHVTLSLADACKHLLILGGTGEGKTTRAIQPLLLQLFDQPCGGLIFDIKGDFHHAVHTLAAQAKRDIVVIGPQHQTCNLLDGLSPEIVASFLKSACLLTQRNGLDSFWIDTAVELCRNGLGVLLAFPQHYSLHGLHRYLFEPTFRQEIHDRFWVHTKSHDAAEQRVLAHYAHYQETVFDAFDDKVKSGVLATVAQILSPFSHPALIDAFCAHTDNTWSFDALLHGQCVLVSLPLTRWGLGAKVAYTLIKLRVFNRLQQRLLDPHPDTDLPVFFLCDEYQEIVSCSQDGLSDLNFWDKARATKTIGIVATQSIASVYAAIGNRDQANALLQNFRQKLCFKTEDQTTLDYLNRLIGQVAQATYSLSHQSGNASTTGRWRQSHNRSTQESVSVQEKPVVDAQLVRRLEPNQAIALLSLNGYSRDDVLTVKPVFV